MILDHGSVFCVTPYDQPPLPPINNDRDKVKPTIIVLYLPSLDCSCMNLLGLSRFLFLLSFHYPNINICVLNTNSSHPVVTHSIHVVSLGSCRACFLQVGMQSRTRHFFAKCTVLPTCTSHRTSPNS